MYANLRVSGPDGYEAAAFEVKLLHGGVLEVQLDKQDSGGRDPVPAGTVYLDGNAGPWTVTADF